MEILSQSARQTCNLGQDLGNKLVGGETIALVGELGSGKTTFVQGLAQGLGVAENIISPTFVLMRQYDIKIKKQKSKSKNLYHVDLYRVVGSLGQEYRNLGLEEIVGKKENIVVIEWAGKAKDALPQDTIWIDFADLGEEKRRIIIR